jgi:hypothetical protein
MIVNDRGDLAVCVTVGGVQSVGASGALRGALKTGRPRVADLLRQPYELPTASDRLFA